MSDLRKTDGTRLTVRWRPGSAHTTQVVPGEKNKPKNDGFNRSWALTVPMGAVAGRVLLR